MVDENLSSITHSFGTGNYTVPINKTLYILNRYSNNGDLKINGTTVLSGTNNLGGSSAGLLLPLIVSPGDVVSSTNSSTSFNGYLADTSYFESSGSNVDSTTISNMGFVDSMTVVNMINSGSGSGGFNFIDPVYLFYTNTEGYGGRHPNSELVYNAGNPNNPPGFKESIYASITKVNPITNNISPNGSDSL